MLDCNYYYFMLNFLVVVGLLPVSVTSLSLGTPWSQFGDDMTVLGFSSGTPGAGEVNDADRSAAGPWEQAMASCPQERVTVATDPSHPLAEGLFGMVFERVLQLLPRAVASPQREMDFRPMSNCYGDPLSALFMDRVANASGACDKQSSPQLQQELSFEDAWQKGWAVHAEDLHSFEQAHELWTGRFLLKEGIQKDVEASVARFPGDGTVLGVHYRGTDKYLEAVHVDAEDMWSIVQEYVQQSDDIAALFVATDDEKFAELAKSRIVALHNKAQRKVKLLMNNAVRSGDGQAVHKRGACAPGLAHEALLDVLTLSRCDMVLKTSSQLSAWAKIFSPTLRVYRVNAFHKRWFPDAGIPLYQPQDAPNNVRSLLRSLQQGEADSGGGALLQELQEGNANHRAGEKFRGARKAYTQNK